MANYIIDKINYNNNKYQFEDNTENRSNHRHYEDDVVPIASKTYTTGYYASAADQATSTYYFMSIRPDDWNKPWKVRFKVYTWVPGQSAYHSVTYSIFTGRTDSISYSNFNEVNTTAHYYITYMTLKNAGYTAGYGHAVAMSMFYATNYTSSSYKRNFQVDVYSAENCTITLLNEPVRQANWTGYNTTNYNGVSNTNASGRGLLETGDANDVNYFHRLYSNRFITKTALYRYLLLFTTASPNILLPMNAVNNSTATNKTLTTDSFDPFGPIYYYSATTNYNANATIATDAALYDLYRFDLRYATNIGSTLTSYKLVYLVMLPNNDGKTVKLASNPITQTVPTTEDGLLYKLLGIAYGSYYLEMFIEKPVYQYKNGSFRLYTLNKIDSKSSMLSFHNIAIADTDWAEDELYEEYPYSVSLYCEGVTADHYCEVILPLEIATSGSIAPLCASAANSVTIYSNDNTLAFNILTIAAFASGGIGTGQYTNTPAYSVGTTPPLDTNLLWADTNPVSGGLKYYNGNTWVVVPVAFS